MTRVFGKFIIENLVTLILFFHILNLYLLSQRIIDIPSVRCQPSVPSRTTERHQLISRIRVLHISPVRMVKHVPRFLPNNKTTPVKTSERLRRSSHPNLSCSRSSLDMDLPWTLSPSMNKTAKNPP